MFFQGNPWKRPKKFLKEIPSQILRGDCLDNYCWISAEALSLSFFLASVFACFTSFVFRALSHSWTLRLSVFSLHSSLSALSHSLVLSSIVVLLIF